MRVKFNRDYLTLKGTIKKGTEALLMSELNGKSVKVEVELMGKKVVMNVERRCVYSIKRKPGRVEK